METSSSAAARQHLQGVGGRGSHESGCGGTTLSATLLENACLDLFLLDLDAPPEQLRRLLAAAWDQDALTALRLVCDRRGVPRNNGERATERDGFLTAALWMLQNHPRTLTANLAAFAEFGYIQDFPELLHRLVVAHGVQRQEEQEEATQLPAALPLPPAHAGQKRARDDADADDDAPATSSAPLDVADPAPTNTEGDEAEPVQAGAGAAEEAVDLKHDDDGVPFGYQILYDAIVDFFVERLGNDLDHLKNGDPSMIGLAAKWCSTLQDSALDQTTLLLSKGIVRRLFPRDCTDAKGVAKPDNHLLGLLRRNVLVPLLTALDKQTSSSRVRHQQAAARAKLPHEIAAKFGREIWVKKPDQTRERITEEWRSMVDGLRARGCLRNCIAVCDVSVGSLKVGSSDLSRLKVCVALGLLIPELSDHPWRNWVHAFSSRRETAATIPISSFGSYADKVAAIREMKCDDRFDLRSVFQWVLQVALQEKVPPTGMARNIIVLTGRDFEQASVGPSDIMRPEDLSPEDFDPTEVRRWRDEYRTVKDLFHKHGFAEHVPGVVFWNLRGEPRSAALTWAKDGVMSLSGYSDDLMRLFLDNSGVVEPEHEMYAAISGENYQKLKVPSTS